MTLEIQGQESPRPERPLLFCLGANHKSAPVELREAMSLTTEELLIALPRVKDQFGFEELAAISTCNRFELFGAVKGHDISEKTIYDAFIAMHEGAITSHFGPSPPPEKLKTITYLHIGDNAVRHLFEVAASLDSMVLGETQITGQFKEAFGTACQAETLGTILNRLGQEALACAKKIRTQTDIGKKPVSISHAAIELAKKVFGDISEQNFLMIGAGEMVKVAAKYVMSYKPKGLSIANRTLANAERLARDLGAGEPFSLEELPTLLIDADIIISSTSSSDYVLDLALIKRTQALRRGRPLFLIDIAVPRDIEPSISELEDVYLFDIDDLEQVVAAHREERRQAAESASELVDKGIIAFSRWLDACAIKPTLAGFRAYVDDLTTRELSRTLGRKIFESLTDEQKKSLKSLIDAIAGKLSADVSVAIKNPPSGFYSDQLAQALEVMFRGNRQKSDTGTSS